MAGERHGFWGSGVLGCWGAEVLRFWGAGVLRFWGVGVANGQISGTRRAAWQNPAMRNALLVAIVAAISLAPTALKGRAVNQQDLDLLRAVEAPPNAIWIDSYRPAARP